MCEHNNCALIWNITNAMITWKRWSRRGLIPGSNPGAFCLTWEHNWPSNKVALAIAWQHAPKDHVSLWTTQSRTSFTQFYKRCHICVWEMSSSVQNVDEAFRCLAEPLLLLLLHNAKCDQNAGISDIMRKEIPVARFMRCEHKPTRRKICKSIENEWSVSEQRKTVQVWRHPRMIENTHAKCKHTRQNRTWAPG